jgi:hypothetical protein
VSLDNTDPPKLKPTLLFVDVRRDLAVLRVPTDRPALEITAPGTELSGLEVAVVGNPRGDAGQAEINKVTTGTLSAPIRRHADQTFYELSAEAFFGNSGGPVVDLKTGKLVGVMQSILGDGKSKSYCIPFGEAVRALEQLPADKKQEAAAIRIAAGRHGLEYLVGKLPVIEENADLTMVGQLILLKTRDQNFSILLDNGKLFTREMLKEEMLKLKQIHADTFKTFAEATKAIDKSPEIPQLLREHAKERIGTCGKMRFLASATTETEVSFRKHMNAYRAASREAIKKFEATYKKYLDSLDASPSASK